MCQFHVAFELYFAGCASTGATFDECRQNILEAIAFHTDGLRRHGQPVPEPVTAVDMLEVAA